MYSNIFLVYNLSTMQTDTGKNYILTDIMKKRTKNKTQIQNKIKSKLALKSKRKKNKGVLINPQKIIKRYRAGQKSYAHYRLKNKHNAHNTHTDDGQASLLLVVRIRGTTDISSPQKMILNRLGLRKINTAVFLKGNSVNNRLLRRVQNYITWGQAGRGLVRQLVFKKLYGKVGQQRVQIKSNAQVQQYIGGDVLCLQDLVQQLLTLGPRFQDITSFVFPFKLSTPQGTLASRFRKPVQAGGHWGYRGDDINQYGRMMI